APHESGCVLMNSDSFATQRVQEAKAQGYEIHFELVQTLDKGLSLKIHNLQPKDDTDWTIARTLAPSVRGPLRMPVSEEDQKLQLQRFVTRFMKFRKDLPALREFLVAELANETSQKVRFGSDGLFTDAKTGAPLSAAEAYEKYVNEKAGNKHFFRAFTEIGSV